jgi:hypothetical protein
MIAVLCNTNFFTVASFPVEMTPGDRSSERVGVVDRCRN